MIELPMQCIPKIYWKNPTDSLISTLFYYYIILICTHKIIILISLLVE